MMVQHLFLSSIFLYVAGALVSLLMNKAGKLANYVSAGSALLASCSGVASAIPVLIGRTHFALEMAGMVHFAKFSIKMDPLSAFMVLIISVLTAATAVYSLSYQKEYVDKGAGVLGFLNNLFISSMILVVTTDNAFYFLVFWELMTLVSYFLVCFEQTSEGIRAGFLYLVVAHAGAALIMISFILLYLHTGTFDFASFRTAHLSPLAQGLVFLLAFFGFGAKAGMMPLHIWLPEAHPAAPSHVSSLMSGVMIKTAIYGIFRVGIDFLGASVWWWGLIVLLFGAISAVLGMLYAMDENDLKRLLAYSSIENVGIILMGVGVGMIGMAIRQPIMEIIGILAALYHIVNHAVFKGLLFLGAGSILYRLQTKNMEELGGLSKKMPWTGFSFLIGALAICAIPPLNGFVSEWFLYQSLFMAGTSDILAVKVLSLLCIVALALTGALAAMCFVKAYGITFGGPSRSDRVAEAMEVPWPMVAGMITLVVGCVALGIGAPVVTPYLANAASMMLGTAPVHVSAGLWVFPASSSQATLSTPLILLLLIGFAIFPLLVIGMQGGMKAGRRVDSVPWACGYGYSPRMAYTATAFSQPLQVLFQPVYRLRAGLIGVGRALSSYSKQAVDYLDRVESAWEKFLYGPLARGTVRFGKRVQVIQMGNVRLYFLYMLAALVVLLIVTVR